MKGSSEPRPPRKRDVSGIAIALLLFACLLAVVLSPGCVSQQAVSACGPGGFCTGPDLSNVRIEIPSQPALRPTQTVWVSAKTGSNGAALDQFDIRWDTYVLHFPSNGSTCSQDMCSSRAVCGFVFVSVGGVVDTPAVQACEGFSQCGSPTSVPVIGGGFASGCPSGGTPPLFTATTNTTYQVLSPPLASQKSVLAEKKVFVVTTTPQQATYRTNMYTEAGNPSYVWYTTWRAPTNTQPADDVTRVDNFSANLQIHRVRVLRGIPKSDPVTGMVALDNPTPVRPSSIILAPNFNPNSSVLRQNHVRCYADAASQDGNIDLTNCYLGLNNTGSAPSGGATPTYIQSQPADMLDWFAEFNPNESQTTGATAPTLAANEVLVIEFTIQES
jgi:hypothetical protein